VTEETRIVIVCFSTVFPTGDAVRIGPREPTLEYRRALEERARTPGTYAHATKSKYVVFVEEVEPDAVDTVNHAIDDLANRVDATISKHLEPNAYTPEDGGMRWQRIPPPSS